jgi:hypothetical protein
MKIGQRTQQDVAKCNSEEQLMGVLREGGGGKGGGKSNFSHKRPMAMPGCFRHMTRSDGNEKIQEDQDQSVGE